MKRSWSEPPLFWTGMVGESGTQKTPAFKLALRPLREIQARELKSYGEQQAQYELGEVRYDKALSAWKRDKSAGDPPEKPTPPTAVRRIVSDTTVEALAPILLVNPRGVLLARDELGGWLRSFDQYKGGRGGDAQHWLSMHAAESITVDRKTGVKLIYVPAAVVSICGGIQPWILDRALGTEHRESGMLARLLLAMPPKRAKRWTEADIPADLEANLRHVFERLSELHFNMDDNGDPVPVFIHMDSAARQVWTAFYDAHAQEQIELTGDLSAAWSKLEGYAARFALLVHLIRGAAGDPTLADSDLIDEADLRAGIAISNWFGNEAKRVYAILAESQPQREDRELVELIQLRGGKITPRQLTRGPRKYRNDIGGATAALEALAAKGKGKWSYPTPSESGGRPSRVFELFYTGDGTETPAGAAETGGFVATNPSGEGVSSPDAQPGDADDWGAV